MSKGFYIGRFQPFHLGHLSAIKQALKEVDRLYIGIGSSQYHHTAENPFTAEERLNMIQAALRGNGLDKKCEIFLIPDIHNAQQWTEHVRSIVPPFEIVFVGDEGIVKTLFQKDGTPVTRVKRESPASATAIREAIKKNKEWKQWVDSSVAEILEEIDVKNRLTSYDRTT